MAKKTRTELSTLAINTNLPDNTTELITPTTERAQLTDERESVVNYKDDLGGVPNAGKFITVATDGESLTMVDEPQGDIQGSGVDGQITYWDGTKTVTSDAMLLIDTTNKTLRIVIPAANTGGGISLNAVSASASSSLNFLNNGVTYAQLYYDNSTANLRLVSGGDVEINPSGTLSVDSGATFGGNVGIGTASIPSDHKLQIHNALAYSRFALSNSTSGSASGDGLKFQLENLNAIIKNQENGYLTFGTNGRETDFTISSGGLATFANGIKFGTGAILDAYEEGGWNPEVIGTTATYTAQDGDYTIIGNRCFFSIRLVNLALTQNSAQVKITLPVTVANQFLPITVFPEEGINTSVSAGSIVGLARPSTAQVDLFTIASSTTNNYGSVTYNDLSDGFVIRLGGHYEV